MNKFINSLSTFVNDTDKIIDLVLGVAVFLILFVFKNKISNALINVFGRVFFRNNKEKVTLLVNSLQKPLSYLIGTIGLYIAFAINYNKPGFTKVFKILIILIICWGIINYLSDNLFLSLRFGENADDTMNTTALKFLANILKIVVIAFGVVMVISELGYNVNGLLTGLGVGGLAVSLAAQDAVGNLISGFIIIFDKPFKVGDLIESATVKGFVEEVTMRSTKIRTLDDSVITVPNSTLTKEAVTNISMMDKRRIKMTFGLVYSTTNETIEKVRNEIQKYIVDNKDILPEPCRIHFREFGDSALNFEVVCYTETSDMDEYLKIENELNLAIKKIVENNDTDFAFPTQTVYVQK
ncbi:mechanosensitive ion channel family protein [uncultured Eubacterium sp.]|uniref:mechanosensitive ion channel family protein n=1 Tax=uncultured Eubacterium sp. TaxID=165185 RepID=UPI0025F293B7|nr:mechanosensitive ion channel family protein [uncultured Eubacterium sp.]